MHSNTYLAGTWQFAQIPSESFPNVKEEWFECEKVPTSVHVELKRLGKIPDPFKDLAEWDVQWIGEADWEFRTTFEVDDQLDEQNVDLIFDGLDTYCTIKLNDVELGETSNMFVSHRLPAKKHLRKGTNELRLIFRSAWLEAKKEEEANGGPKKLWNGDSCRLYSRKAQYGWGWDWGPILMTAGPWRPISLEAYTYRFEDLRIDTHLIEPEYTQAKLSAKWDFGAHVPSKGYKIHFELCDSDGKVVKEAVVGVEDGLSWNLDKGEVDAWWPIHYGKQPLYRLEVRLVDKDGTSHHLANRRVAFRNARVVQEPLLDQPGTTFLFEVNGVRIFIGGSNWIPADSFLTEVLPARLKSWIELMVKGNQNMLRVWGGGVYEDENLYDACDEYGILVWQDFMFGCGLYPSYPQLNDSIKNEAEQAVKRLRDHPSVVIFAGNNEDYQIAEEQGVIDYSDNSGDYLKTGFPARHIYEILLPEVVERLSSIHYHRGSPYGGVDTKDRTVGDIHQWNVWHGTQEPWSNWDILSGRFVSEFGMQGYPDIRTVKAWQGEDKSQNFPQSRVSVNHNKADGFERRLELYLMENFRHAFDMDSYVYYTQIMQAETLAAAYRLWRREWRGRGREYTAGALVWQLNDCWPCVSWAIADYYLRPKPSFFAIAREMRSFTVGMARKDIKTPKNKQTAAFFEIKQEVQLWGCNSTLQAKEATVELVAFDLDEGEVDRRDFKVILAPNSSTEIWKGDVPGQPIRTSDGQVPRPIILHARLIDNKSSEVLARYSNWPEPWKYLTFPEPHLEIDVKGEEVRLSCKKPIKGIVLDIEGASDDDGSEPIDWSDQGIDLMPGDEQVVIAKGLRGRKIKARYLGDGTA